VVIAAPLCSISWTSPAAGSAPSRAISAEASISVLAEVSAASVTIALLDVQFLFPVPALGLLGAERSYLAREGTHRGRHGIIWNRTQNDVIAEIFGKDGAGAPPLAHGSGNGNLTPTRYRKTLCHGHGILS
jgi:hypothetical protein